MKKTAFITGAEGFIGSNLIGFLQAKGWNVIGGYLLHSSAPFAQSGNLRYVHLDLRNGQRIAATATVSSLWNQQSLPGPIGPRIFSGLQDPDGKHSAVQYHGPRQEK